MGRSRLALDILADSDRVFGSSIFIKLEVLPIPRIETVGE